MYKARLLVIQLFINFAASYPSGHNSGNIRLVRRNLGDLITSILTKDDHKQMELQAGAKTESQNNDPTGATGKANYLSQPRMATEAGTPKSHTAVNKLATQEAGTNNHQGYVNSAQTANHRNMNLTSENNNNKATQNAHVEAQKVAKNHATQKTGTNNHQGSMYIAQTANHKKGYTKRSRGVPDGSKKSCH
ncbi:expressed protein [Phakopsora pachyrhizi]|uniref:Expressed protein n=1 Tax=Phakopsora pachyrhizi TaxID=170000 RepID=A0AAV0B4G7_PHAPC|nr:expressed protein [Phakopsora pachyrhizi]